MGEHRLTCCLVQLYGDLQPENAEPLSVMALAAALRHHLPTAHVTIHTIGSFQTPDEQRQTLENIAACSYDVVGLSCPQGTFAVATAVLDRLYTPDKRPYILLGHALPTYAPEAFLSRYSQAFVVQGWGESAFVEFCRQVANGTLSPTTIPSLIYLDEAGVMRRTAIQMSQAAHLPTRSDAQRYFARIESSRGCHFNTCTFCARPPLGAGQKPWQRLSVSATIQQVERLVGQGVTTFTFADEDFIGDSPESAYEIARQLAEIPNLDFALSVRADNIYNPDKTTEENALLLRIFQTLKAAGLSLVFIGAESFADTQLRRYGKGSTAEENIASIRLLETLGIELELGLIVFDPLVSKDELRQNIATLRQTGFWAYAGQLYSFMRVQQGTPYQRLLAKQSLLGALDINMLEYSASYQSAPIAQIVDLCRMWNRVCNPLYLALRNVNRSELGTGRYHAQILTMRQTQLAVLDTLVNIPEVDGPEAKRIVSDGIARVHRVAMDIASILSQRAQLTIGERILHRAATSFTAAKEPTAI